MHYKTLAQDGMIEFLNAVIVGLISNKCSPERIVEMVGILNQKCQFHQDRYRAYNGTEKKQKSKFLPRQLQYSPTRTNFSW